jgi:hypothetical protein
MGFPIPFALALWITFNESLGAFLIGSGFLTRLLAAIAALGMAGALYTSVRLGEDCLRAALYLIVFTALVLTGPGKFSVDRLFSNVRDPQGQKLIRFSAGRLTSGATRHGGFVLRRTRRRDELRRASNGVN